jgi:hypothetical protein
MRNRTIIAYGLLAFLIPGCMAAPTPDTEATVAAALAATQTAQPTATSTTTSTATPTATSTPTATATGTATSTATVTATPSPTSTPTETPAPEAAPMITSTLDSGWVLYTLAEAGFEIGLPPTWQTLVLSAEALETLLEIVGERYSEMGSMLSSEMVQSLIASGVKLYGFDLSPEALTQGAPVSINVIQTELPLKMPFDSYVSISLAQIKALAGPDAEVEHHRLTLSDHKAEEIMYQYKMMDFAGQDIAAAIVQYLLLDDNTAYVISMIAPWALEETYVPTFQEIAQTFRLLE